MKQGIHPNYQDNVKVTCSCGNNFITGSTVDEINIEVCSNCHPFYTGKQKLVDTAKRVDKFEARVAKSKELAKLRKVKKVKKTKVNAQSNLKKQKNTEDK